MRVWKRGLILVMSMAAALSAAPLPCPHNAPVTTWPVTRIIANLEQHLAASPEDLSIHYELGRTHAWAAFGVRSSLPRSQGTLPKVRQLETGQPELSPQEILDHLEAAVRHLRKSIEARQWTSYRS